MKRLLPLFLVFVAFLGCSGPSHEGRRVGVDESWYPLNFGTRNNNVTGFSTELLTEIGKMEKIPFVKVPVNWDDLIQGLLRGNYEAILSSMPPYIFKQEQFDFSEIYLPLGPVLVVPVGSKIHGLDMLNGKEIAVISGSGDDLILEPSEGVLIRYYDSIPKALNDIVNQTVDGAMIDILSATAYCKDLYQGKLMISTPPLTDEGLRMVTLHKKATDLMKGFNAGLDKLKKDGDYKQLLSKWSL